MPKLKTNIAVRCNQCPDHPTFHSLSALRKHQWAQHREQYSGEKRAKTKRKAHNGTSHSQESPLVGPGIAAESPAVLTVPEAIAFLEKERANLEAMITKLNIMVTLNKKATA